MTIPKTSAGVFDFDAAVQLFADEITRYGGAGAYKTLATSVRDLTPSQQHTLAHAFGRALYMEEGTTSLSVCDAQFSYGCFHEFLGQAIAQEGLAVVKELNQQCVDTLGPNALSCQHGIGHGVEAYVGYTEDDLKKALTICGGLPFNDPIGSCYGGVFMEYNLETMRNIGEIRAVEDNKLQAPCPELDSIYKPACYFWQPQWWAQALRPSAQNIITSLYVHIGLLCQRTPDEYRRYCFEGTGTNVPADADFDPETAKALCETVSPGPLDQLYCKSYAANSLSLGGAGKVANGLEVCEGLVGEFYDYCSAYAHNKANITNELADPLIP